MKKFIPVILIALAFVLAFHLGAKIITFEDFLTNRDQILTFRDINYFITVVIFSLIYVFVVTISIPGATVLSVTGGFIFGLKVGLTLNVVSATLGATLLFLAVRMGFRDTFRGLDENSDRFKNLIKQLKVNEINLLLLLRLIPVVPFFCGKHFACDCRCQFEKLCVDNIFWHYTWGICFYTHWLKCGCIFRSRRSSRFISFLVFSIFSTVNMPNSSHRITNFYQGSKVQL